MNSLAGQFRISFLVSGDKENRGRIFDEIWRSYQQRIAVFVRYATRAEAGEVEDITQEIMIRVYRNLHRYNPIFSFNGWIYTLARNYCIDHLRKTSAGNNPRNRADNVDLDTVESTMPDPEQLLIDDQQARFIGGFINSLEYRDRQAAFLRFYEGMSYKSIAGVLDIPVGTLKYRIHVIRQNLKSAMKERDAIRT
ncbi:MAG: sigma-70 family RNA polymerase sigma factor [Candidatus Glassbacteria bacterium]|nr:sigma-70 family RNA polymerase sigma factor [Candidatus Glassbacteria bacterium]